MQIIELFIRNVNRRMCSTAKCQSKFVFYLQGKAALETPTQSLPLLSCLDAFRHFTPMFCWTQEEVHVVGLNAHRIPIATKLIFRGTVDFCLFHPRDVFRFLLEINATSFIIAHNHPSEDPTPSFPDILLTKKLFKASELLQIEMIDHLILTQNQYSSLKTMGVFGKNRRTKANSF